MSAYEVVFVLKCLVYKLWMDRPIGHVMASAYRIENGLRLVLIYIGGRLDDQGMKAGIQSLMAEPDFDPTYGELIDARGIDSAITFNGMISVGAKSPFKHGTKRAFVVTELFSRGIANQYGFLSTRGGSSFRVFSSVPKAIEWLGYSTEAEAGQILTTFAELREEVVNEDLSLVSA